MKNLIKTAVIAMIVAASAQATDAEDRAAITRAALDYIESQHTPNPEMMERALHSEMKKRTYWKQADGSMGVMESTVDGMISLAGSYNKDGDRFPAKPRKDIEIYDVDGNVASVKLTADDWIDYMHLMKVDGEWKIINVLWQFHDHSKHGVK